MIQESAGVEAFWIRELLTIVVQQRDADKHRMPLRDAPLAQLQHRSHHCSPGEIDHGPAALHLQDRRLPKTGVTLVDLSGQAGQRIRVAA